MTYSYHAAGLLRAKAQGCAPLPMISQRVQHERELRMRESLSMREKAKVERERELSLREL